MLNRTSPEQTEDEIKKRYKNPTKDVWIKQQIEYWKSKGYKRRTPDGMDFKQFDYEYTDYEGPHKIETNIYGRNMRDPNMFRKDIKVKQATVRPARQQEEMGSKLVEFWVSDFTLSATCPNCHHYSVVEMPNFISHHNCLTGEIQLSYHCEWCNQSFSKYFVDRKNTETMKLRAKQA